MAEMGFVHGAGQRGTSRGGIVEFAAVRGLHYLARAVIVVDFATRNEHQPVGQQRRRMRPSRGQHRGFKREGLRLQRPDG